MLIAEINRRAASDETLADVVNSVRRGNETCDAIGDAYPDLWFECQEQVDRRMQEYRDQM